MLLIGNSLRHSPHTVNSDMNVAVNCCLSVQKDQLCSFCGGLVRYSVVLMTAAPLHQVHGRCLPGWRWHQSNNSSGKGGACSKRNPQAPNSTHRIRSTRGSHSFNRCRTSLPTTWATASRNSTHYHGSGDGLLDSALVDGSWVIQAEEFKYVDGWAVDWQKGCLI